MMSYLLIVGFVGFYSQELRIPSPDYSIETLPSSMERVVVEGFGYTGEPGKPKLPAKVFLIALPPGAKVLSVAVAGDEPITLPGTHKIAPAPPMLPHIYPTNKKIIEEIRRKWEKDYKEVYSSDEVYPKEVGRYVGSGGLRKYTFVRVSFVPFAYRPKSGRLTLYHSALVTINYSLPSPGSPEARKVESLLFDTIADNQAQKLFINWSQAKQWYLPKERKEYLQPYDYMIITTDALQDAVASLVSWKESIGYGVKVVTDSWIESEYSGTDLQEQIRNFLIDKYTEWGIEYVLLVGDITDIPMRHCYPDPTNHGSDPNDYTPTDYYYADLTGNWDSDGDGYYGEYGEDSVDFVPEVYVGRIPWSDPGIVEDICKKLVKFERDTTSWKKNALLLGAFFSFTNQDGSGYPKTDGACLMEEVITNLLSGWSYTTMYEKDGLEQSTYSCTQPLNQSNVISNWSGNDYGIVNWCGYGDRTAAYRIWWDTDDGDGVPEYTEIGAEPFISLSDVSSLDNDHPSITFCCSSENGYPEESNLGKQLIYNGSAGVVASIRGNWCSIGWENKDHGGCASIDYYFFHYMIGEDRKVGEALFDSKVYYSNNFFWWEWRSQQNMFDFCLYGDPSLHHPGISIAAPDIAVSPDTILFSYTTIPPEQDTAELWVKNEGDADLTVSDITKTASWITSIEPISFLVIPGDSHRVEVIINTSGLTPNTYYDFLQIVSNDPDETPYSQSVKLVISALPDIAVSPDTLEFKEIQDTASIWVKNEGNAGLSISSITKTASWITSIDPVSFTVAPGDSQRVDVTVDGSGLSPGTLYDNLQIVSNDPDENPYSQPVKFDVSAIYDIAVYPDTLSFGKVQDTAWIWVKSEGNAPLSVSGITTEASWIISIDPVSFTIQPGDSQRVDVIADGFEFAPDTLYDVIELTSNDPDENPYYEPIMLIPILIVYPGDTDNNGIVDGRDVLPIGRYWRFKGTQREEISSDWSPKEVLSWSIPKASYTDCNGDGLIDGRDVLPIGRNWRKTHPSSGLSFAIDPDDPELKRYIENFQELYASLEGGTEAIQEIRELLLKILKPVPKCFRLCQNYPNPFYDKTSLRFEIPEKSRVSLKVYNCAGELVAILTQGIYEPGYYNILWNRRDIRGRKVVSGIYFCSAVMQPTDKKEDFKAFKKMVILEGRR